MNQMDLEKYFVQKNRIKGVLENLDKIKTNSFPEIAIYYQGDFGARTFMAIGGAGNLDLQDDLLNEIKAFYNEKLKETQGFINSILQQTE